ncbi:MAG: hypothetical protein FWD45_05385 [Coriobacteriia bacterium]|nr:hypothetical protein [Coriobacteriia bacterium]
MEETLNEAMPTGDPAADSVKLDDALTDEETITPDTGKDAATDADAGGEPGADADANDELDSPADADAADPDADAEPISEPHQVSLAVWDIPSPVNCESSFSVIVGAKCHQGCQISGSLVTIYDTLGIPRGSGLLGDELYSDSVSLYWTRVQLMAPAEIGNYSWEARLTEDSLLAIPVTIIVEEAEEQPTESTADADLSGSTEDTSEENLAQPDAEADSPAAEGEGAEEAGDIEGTEEAGDTDAGAENTDATDTAAAEDTDPGIIDHQLATRVFNFSSVAKPEHHVTITVVAQNTLEYPGTTQVMLRPYSISTVDSGVVSFYVAPGTYKLFARCDRYEDYNEIIQVNSDMQITIELEPSEYEEDYRGNFTRIEKD